MSEFITNGLLDDCDPLLNRQDCFDTLDQAFERPFICITGGQGSGKTVLVSSYIKDRNLPAIWFTLRHPTHDYAQFCHLLDEGLISLGREATLGNELNLLETMSTFEQRLVIVVDCAHLQPDTKIVELLLKFVQFRSHNLIFVLISRHRLKLPYAKLKAQKKIYEWKTGDLSFTHSEVESLFKLEGIKLKPDELQEITFQTGGWALGVSYLANSWREATPQERKPIAQLLDALLHELFSEDNGWISSRLLKDFTYLSVIHELKTEIVNAYLLEGESDRIWGELGPNCFFLQRNEDYSYHLLPVVRSFLYRRLLSTEGYQKVKEAHLKAGRIYEEQFQYYFAFAHCLAGGWYEEAARLMQFMMNFYTPERFLLLMDGSLEEICPSISISTFSMFLFRSVPMSILQSYVPNLKQALAQLELDGSPHTLLNLQHRLGLILFYSGEILEAQTLFERSLATSERLGHEEYAIVNLSLLAQCCRFLDQLEQGINLARRALARIELYGAYAGKMHTIWVLSELLIEQGDLVAAKPIIDKLMKWGESYEDSTARLYTSFVKAKYARLNGHLDEALEWAQQGYIVASEHSLAPDLGWACLEMGCIYQERKEMEHALEWLTQSAEYFQHYHYFYKLVDQRICGITKPNIQEVSDASIIPSGEYPNSAPHIVLHMLGPLRMTRNGAEVSIPRKSSLLLFLYLALNYGKKLPKDQILEALFPDGDYVAQNNRFYVSLSILRKALEPDLKSGRDSSFILQNGDLISLNHSYCTIDIVEFEHLLNLHEGTPDNRVTNLLRAEKLYQGDLLEEYPYESFLNPAREIAQRRYHDLLLELARHYLKQRDFQKGMDYFDRLLERNEYAEPLYLEYIQTLLENEFRNHAKRIADKMIRRVENDLGIPVTSRLKDRFPGLI